MTESLGKCEVCGKEAGVLYRPHIDIKHHNILWFCC